MKQYPELHFTTDHDDIQRPYWNSQIETMPVEAMREFQLHKLRRQVQYLAANSILYREKFKSVGFDPKDLRAIADLSHLPFTTKEELRLGQDDFPPFGSHQAAPMDRIIRVTSTSGTTGRPVFQGYTHGDVARRSESICRALWAFGVRPGDRVINGFALSMFNAGVPFCLGIENLGAVSIPVGAERRAEGLLKIAQQLRATVFVGTPSFASYLAEKSMEILGVPADELGFRIICGGGESGFEIPSFQREMGRLWGTAHVYDLASTSDAHPNSFAHCYKRNGKHHTTPDFALVQLIDPNTGLLKDIEDGVEGEYIFTHLDREACALLRYRTGDVIKVYTAPCECGRTGFRMDIIGRSDDMLIIRGTNVFPSAIQTIVSNFIPQTTGKIQIVLPKPGPRVDPPLRIRVECNEGIDRQSNSSADMKVALESKLRSDLTVTSAVELVAFGTFERTSTKTRLTIIES